MNHFRTIYCVLFSLLRLNLSNNAFLRVISAKICIIISFVRVRYFLITHYFYSIILTLFVELIITELFIILFNPALVMVQL
jgi:hypothetical protein